ncbi:unnamed protein product, partial [Symbiodinium microadriaticum]
AAPSDPWAFGYRALIPAARVRRGCGSDRQEQDIEAWGVDGRLSYQFYLAKLFCGWSGRARVARAFRAGASAREARRRPIGELWFICFGFGLVASPSFALPNLMSPQPCMQRFLDDEEGELVVFTSEREVPVETARRRAMGHVQAIFANALDGFRRAGGIRLSQGTEMGAGGRAERAFDSFRPRSFLPRPTSLTAADWVAAGAALEEDELADLTAHRRYAHTDPVRRCRAGIPVSAAPPNHGTLAYFATFLAYGWQLARETNNVAVEAFCGRGTMMVEQMVRDGGRFAGGLVAAGAAAWGRKAKFAAHHAGFAGLENGRRELCFRAWENAAKFGSRRILLVQPADETAEKEHPKWKDRLSKLVVRFVKTPAFGPDSLGRSCEKFSGDFLEFLCIDDHVSVQILKRAAALTLLLLLCTAEIARYRRPALCILDQCFRDAAQQPPDVIVRLSQRTRNELLMVAIVGPLRQTDLRTGWCPEVFCMDASPTGAGLCTAPVPENAVAELHRYSEQRGFYTKLEAPSSAALREMGEEVRAFLLGYPAAFTRQLAASSLAAKGTLPYTLGGGLYNGILHVYSGQNRQLMTSAWQIDKKWQFAEPGESRPVISVPIVQAVTSLGLVWKWSRFVGVVLIGFLCMLHPSEYLMLTRGDLILPSDVLSRDRVAYVAVQMTRFCVIEALFGHLPFDCRLYPGSKNTFRSQWNAVMQRLEIPFKQADKGVTPGVLRGSGVTHLYLETEGLVKVVRRGRWARQKTVEFYLQEVAAQVVLQRWPAQSRARIAGLAEFLARLVDAYACSAMRSKHLEGELRRSIDRRLQYQGEGNEGKVRRSTARAAESLRPGEGELRQSIARRSQYQGRGDEGDVGHQICQVMYVVRFPASRKARGELRQSIARRSQHQGPDSEGDVRRSIARKSESSRPNEGELRQSIARRSQYQGRGDEGELRHSIARRSQHQGPDSEGDVRRSIARKSESSRSGVPCSCITEVSFDNRLPDALSTRAAATKVSFDIRLPGALNTRAQTAKVMYAVRLPANRKVQGPTKVMFAARLAASQKVRGQMKVMCTLPWLGIRSFMQATPTVPAAMETKEVRLDSLLRPGSQTMAWAMQVHIGGQPMLPSPYHSFVASGQITVLLDFIVLQRWAVDGLRCVKLAVEGDWFFI